MHLFDAEAGVFPPFQKKNPSSTLCQGEVSCPLNIAIYGHVWLHSWGDMACQSILHMQA
jgi:hypothetical protein